MGRHEEARYGQRPKNAVRREKRIVDSGGVRLVVRDSGGRGKPAVLVHGLGLARHTWRQVAPVLSAGDRPRGRGVTIRAIVKRHDTSYIYGEPDSIFYEVPSGGEKASGVIRLVGCDFIGTKLKDIAVVGTKEELRDWKSEFNYRGKDGE